MPKPLLHITATAKQGTRVDLFYYSIRQAAYFNPALEDFKVVGEHRMRYR